MDVGGSVPLRALSKGEKLMNMLNLSGSVEVAYTLIFRSAEVLTYETIKEALKEIQRMYQFFQVTTIGERYHLLTSPTLPLEKCPSHDWKHEHIHTVNSSYKEGQLLWRAKYLPRVAGEGNDNHSALVLGCAHLLVDWKTLLVISTSLLEVINRILTGRPYKSTVEVGLGLPVENQLDPTDMQMTLTEWKFSLTLLKNIFAPKNLPLFVNHPPPKPEAPKTGSYLPDGLTVDETRLFINKCRLKEATVSSAILVACCVALQKVCGDSCPRNVDLTATITVDNRRFYSGEEYPLGLHVSKFDQDVRIGEGRDNFWGIAKEMANSIKEELNKKTPLRLPRMLNMFPWGKKAARNALSSCSVLADFGISNVGECQTLFDGSGPVVEAVRQVCSTNYNNTPTAYVIMASTFRHRFFLHIDYSSYYVEERVAASIGDLVMDIIKKESSSERT